MSASVASIGIRGLESACAILIKILQCFRMGFVRTVWLLLMLMDLAILSVVSAQTVCLGILIAPNVCVQPEVS